MPTEYKKSCKTSKTNILLKIIIVMVKRGSAQFVLQKASCARSKEPEGQIARQPQQNLGGIENAIRMQSRLDLELRALISS